MELVQDPLRLELRPRDEALLDGEVQLGNQADQLFGVEVGRVGREAGAAGVLDPLVDR